MTDDSNSDIRQHAMAVHGMTCQRCVAAVTRALTSVEGVRNATVSLEDGAAAVAAHADVAPERLADAVRQAGFSTTADASSAASAPLVSIGRPAVGASEKAGHEGSPKRSADRPVVRLDIRGMHCAACVARVEQQLSAVPHVTSASVTLTPGRATITMDAAVDSAPLISAIKEAGYDARTAGAMRDAFSPLQLDAQRWLQRTMVAAVCLLCFALPSSVGPTWLISIVKLVAAGITMAVTGRPFIVGAIRQAKHGAVNMDTLVATSTSVAFVAGAWSVLSSLHLLEGLPRLSHTMALMDAVMILGFISFGKWLEAKTRTQATRSLQDLLELAPETAIVIRDQRRMEAPAESVKPGETILIGPGERAPLDAVVSEGQSAVDESWLTGESLPVRKRRGDPIWAGSVNGSGQLQAQVTSPAGDSWVARIVEQVESTLESKAPIQRLADQAARWFTPIVFSIAALSAVGWWLAGDPSFALRTLVTVLIVACPCALGLATPIAIVVATSAAARRGLLFRHAESLETLGRVRQFVFDKTGTLTDGQLAVQGITTPSDNNDNNDNNDINKSLSMAAAVLQASSHPVARAVVAHVVRAGAAGGPSDHVANGDAQPELPAAEQVEETPGDGVTGIVAGRQVMAGNRDWLLRHGVRFPADITELPEAQVEISIDGQWVGGVVLGDEPREEAAQVVAALQRMGIQVRLLSGDAEERVAQLARMVGVREFVAGARPDEKLAAIQRWQQTGLVAMVGDGMNDGPSLTAADVGIAMGKGADISVEAADVVLSRGTLHNLPVAWRLSHRTIRVIRQNLLWAVLYNLLLIPWAAGWLAATSLPPLPPSVAAAAMALSSVTVVANSLRLRLVDESNGSTDTQTSPVA